MLRKAINSETEEQRRQRERKQQESDEPVTKAKQTSVSIPETKQKVQTGSSETPAKTPVSDELVSNSQKSTGNADTAAAEEASSVSQQKELKKAAKKKGA